MRRLRFSLIGFLLFALLAGAIAGYWLQQQREAEAAWRSFARAVNENRPELEWRGNYIAASRRICFEACDVPFGDRELVMRAHRERMERQQQLLCYSYPAFASTSERQELREVFNSALDGAIRWETQGYPDGAR